MLSNLPGRPAESLLLWSAVLLLHAAVLWLLHASLRAPSRVTLQLLPPPVAAEPAASLPTLPVAVRRRERPPAAAGRASDASISTSTQVQPAATASSPADAPADALTPLDLQRATREAIREVERQSRGLVQAPRAPVTPAESETTLGREIARATRPDCKDAYAGAGLLAIPLTLYEAAGGKGTNCRWR